MTPSDPRPLMSELFRLLDPAERAKITQPEEILIDLYLAAVRLVQVVSAAALAGLLLLMARAVVAEWMR